MRSAEYIIIGAGPAGICAVASLLKKGVSSTDIVWIDPQFEVGDFGTTLSIGTSVPGNTSVENYQKVNREIYQLFPESKQKFDIDNLPRDFVCSLKIASDPLRLITQQLRQRVASIQGKVATIKTGSEGLLLKIKFSDGSQQAINGKRVIIATGAQPKKYEIGRTMIEPNVVFIESVLTAFLKKNPQIKTAAVIGSSHSAALATMHLLQAGLNVKQFMNKEYKYATPAVSPTGMKYTQYDNTGLKGEVAKFTKELFSKLQLGDEKYSGKFAQYVGKDRKEIEILLKENLQADDCVVATIGYEPTAALLVNNKPVSALKHNNKTTEFEGIKGLFGIGIGFPQEVTAISGEVESSVGVSKFWSTVNNPKVLATWRKNSANFFSNKPVGLGYCHRMFAMKNKVLSGRLIAIGRPVLRSTSTLTSNNLAALTGMVRKFVKR